MLIWAVVGMAVLNAVDLPVGSAPAPVKFPWFPDTLHAYVWGNWDLVPVDRLAKVVGAEPAQINALARSMGLPDQPAIPKDLQIRSYITVIRRNWHLLPYEQLLELLGWTPEQLAFTLREDDFLYVKLGSLKPNCPPLHYAAPGEAAKVRAAEIARAIQESFPEGLGKIKDPLFGFVKRLSEMPSPALAAEAGDKSLFNPRYCSSYFALYGDPFLETEADSFPEGYLARLAETGVNGVWVQAVLYKLAPFPWDASLSERHEERLAGLAKLVAKAKQFGMGIHLYINEPRAMPQAFYEKHPGLKGVSEGDYAALCSSAPEVQEYLRNSVAAICRAVPDLAGFFTISASENLTNCWSHYQGAQCPRCKELGAPAVITQLATAIRDGIAQGGGKAQLTMWDWGWQDPWVKPILDQLPKDVRFMSVSEWSLPIERGGVKTEIGEYSISSIGPGPRATRHWAFAREAGLKTLAKVQANNTWEISSTPYIPAVANVAQHAFNLRGAHVDGIMLGWTLGGCPSPNLEVFAEMGRPDEQSVEGVLKRVAERRFGAAVAPAAVEAWKAFSTAFSEYPYGNGGLYSGPQQMGPANPLWEQPTGYAPTMVGLPYDGLDQWRSIYPAGIFAGQFEKMAAGFDTAIAALRTAAAQCTLTPLQAEELNHEIDVADACAIHFRSVANQCRFVMQRNGLAKTADKDGAAQCIASLEALLKSESSLAARLYAIQTRDSRIGYEASNHYFYIPSDLAAKVINCRDLLRRWLPEERRKRGL